MMQFLLPLTADWVPKGVNPDDDGTMKFRKDKMLSYLAGSEGLRISFWRGDAPQSFSMMAHNQTPSFRTGIDLAEFTNSSCSFALGEILRYAIRAPHLIGLAPVYAGDSPRCSRTTAPPC